MICQICHRECEIREGEIGFCGVRKNVHCHNIPVQNTITSACFDPIEKKNIYHYYPGGLFLTIGYSGCSFKCNYCQNWRIVHFQSPEYERDSSWIVNTLKGRKCTGLAFSYSEPTIRIESMLETCQAVAKEFGKGYPIVVYTNGYAQEPILNELHPYVGAWAVSMRGPAYIYDEVAPGIIPFWVIANIDNLKRLGAHVEVPYVALTDLSDDPAIFGWFLSIMREIDITIPIHILRTIPHHEFHHAPTDLEKLEDLQELAKAWGFPYVYVANVDINWQDTTCGNCSSAILERNDLGLVKSHVTANNSCEFCNSPVSIKGEVRQDYQNVLVALEGDKI